MNKLIIIGNLTGNPESRVVNLQNGPATVCSFTVAVNRSVRGNKTTEYFRVSCWNKQAENAMKYLTRGSKVSVTGPVTVRAYTAKDGTSHASMEIPAEEIEYLSSRQNTSSELPPPAPAASPDDFMNIPDGIDSEIPFM
jgi:single-strand DNA-binding protein